ncbi:MAG: heparan-alpha-glucosaminide N-acetyltransferase domain-containing protein, partial [Candidatus Hodarchaeota archaeon]
MTAEEERADMDSVDLLHYLKEEIPVDDLRDFASPKRIKSIDAVKGLAIIFIILAHIAGAWFDSEWIYIYGIVYALLDILGPSLFVFMSALSVIFSVKRKQGKVPEKVIRNGIITRGIVIVIIGIIFNLFSFEFTIRGYPLHLRFWGWSILFFLGFSQIFSLYALKLNKMARIIIGMLIIFSSEYITSVLYDGKNAGNPILTFFHYILISPIPMTPVIPWLSICFISTIFGEYLYDAMIAGTKQDYKILFRIFLIWGVIFVGFGILLGFRLHTPETLSLENYPHLYLLEIANSQNFTDFRFSGMPDFLIRGRASNMWYNLGAALTIIAVSFYYLDIKEKMNNFFSMLIYYGKVSLSLFLVHYAFITLFLNQLNIIFLVLIFLGY